MAVGEQIATSVINNIVIPELLAFIRGFHSANGTLPTSEQVIAGFEAERQRYVDAGQAFLQRTPATPT